MNEWSVLLEQLRAAFRGRSGWGTLALFPVTLVMLALIVAAAWLTARESAQNFARTVNDLGVSWDLLRQGRLWHIFTGSLIQTTPGISLRTGVLVALSLGFCELLAGHLVTITAFFLADWSASIGEAVGVRLLAWGGNAEAVRSLSVADVGSSAAIVGCLAVACALLPGRLSPIAFGVLVAIALASIAGSGLEAGLAHVTAAVVGGAIGLLVRRRRAVDAARGVRSNAALPD